ncbi:MAG: SDR family NAD(P)-dependent oxidoreductase [Burkholderiaceae bacterium]
MEETAKPLTGQVAVVTGAGRDIGRAVALQLAADGAKVAINYLNSAEGANSAVAEITASGGQAFALKGDMTSDKDVASLVSQTCERFGGAIHIVAHVTGGLVARKTIAEMEIEHWNRVLDLNLTSYIRIIKAALPAMSNGGAIIGVASQAGRDGGGPGAVAYASSKGAMMTATRGLAKELGPSIRVNSVCPGMIDTDFHNIFTKPEVRSHVASITPLKREGTSEDVAHLVAYLASEKAAFITGANIDINGGLVFS